MADTASTGRRYLSSDAVRNVLLSIGRESINATARRLGCSRQAISLIQTGQTHTKLFPDIPRRPKLAAKRPRARSCLHCTSWVGHGQPCRSDVPDCLSEGVAFAVDCDLYSSHNP